MIGQHLKTFLWLRWRLRLNQLKKGGIANIVILAILAAILVLGSLFMFILLFISGAVLLKDSSPFVLMVVWDALIVGFLMFSAIGVLTDLQRSEALSLDKMLHLPVSLRSAFVVNFLSSLVSFSTVLFVPSMIGLTLGLAISSGPELLLLLFPTLAFLMAVKALIYQFQGWLASLMANKRRRQTIIVMVSIFMILLFQLPNMFNIFHSRHGPQGPSAEQLELKQKIAALEKQQAERPIEKSKHKEEVDLLNKDFEAKNKARSEEVQEVIRVVNMVVPPGWVALSAMDLAAGNALAALLGTLGLGGIATLSLWRAYGTTMRYYTGAYTAGKKAKPVKVRSVPRSKASAVFMEKKLPWISEPATAITLASFRSLLRAPEAKMLLLSPLLMVIIFGSMILSSNMDPPEYLRLLFPAGAMAMILISLVSVAGNQFGFDRNGFRVYVLCPAARADILLGKNLALVPIALVLAGLPSILLVILFPLRIDYLLTVPVLWLAMLFVFFSVSNLMSILAPAAIAPGSLKPMQAKGLFILLQIVFVFVFPLVLAVTLIPYGLELLLDSRGILSGWPVCLVLTCLECALLGGLYYLVLGWQGRLLQGSEQRVLELVTVKAE
jgi:ABC-2 type transport system permease protein